MFDVGFMELVLLFIIGLLVLGPQRLPKVAAEIGKWVGRARRTATQLRRQLEREIELDEVIRPKPPPRPGSPSPTPAAAAEPAADPDTPSGEVQPSGIPPAAAAASAPPPPSAAGAEGVHEPGSAAPLDSTVEVADEPPRV
jgi:sec-independent protein translocase protein TatB